MWYWHKDKHIDQLSRTESSEINPYIYCPWIFDKSAKIILWGKYSLLKNGTETTHMQKNMPDSKISLDGLYAKTIHTPKIYTSKSS